MSAENVAGRKLNNYERSLVDRLSDINYRANNIQNIQPRDDVIHTNELAAKGGFNRSVAVESYDNSAAQVKLQQEIKNLFLENNKLQTKISESLIDNH